MMVVVFLSMYNYIAHFGTTFFFRCCKYGLIKRERSAVTSVIVNPLKLLKPFRIYVRNSIF
jgi:hypothetical protein